ncbi:hypothetical protein RB595_006428 [Gaeumannomyces hyphopodioides]
MHLRAAIRISSSRPRPVQAPSRNSTLLALARCRPGFPRVAPSPTTRTMSATTAAAGVAEKPLINLIRGWPAPRQLPADLLKAAAERALADPAVFVPGLQYAPDPGFQPLREELAAFLDAYYHPGGELAAAAAAAPDAARICISGGASQNLACILGSFTDPAFTRAVWAVAPCYHLSNPIFEDAGFKGRLRAVPEDDEGIDLEWLERGLKSFGSGEPAEPVFKNLLPDRKAYRHIIYAVPTSANPSGKTMSLRRRQGLIRLAREHDGLVICDDVYDFLQWPVAVAAGSGPESHLLLPRQRPPPRLVDVDRALTAELGPGRHDAAGFGHAVSNGSFSKMIAPGVRTGWAEGTPAFIAGLAHTGANRSGGAASQLAAVMIWDMIRTGALAAHVDGVVRPDLQRRHSVLLGALRTELAPLGVRFEEPQSTYGGYFVWLTLPDSVPAAIVARRALRDENLVVAAGDMFQVNGDDGSGRGDNDDDGAKVRFPHNLRLCYSWEDEERLVEGVERLARVLQGFRDRPPTAEEADEAQQAFGFV